MKKLLYTLAVSSLLFTACDLNMEPEDKLTSETFPATQEQAIKQTTGIYSVMNYAITDPSGYSFYIYDLTGDDRLGGGSTSNKNSQSADRLMNEKTSWFEVYWSSYYQGIYRANSLIETIDNVKEWPTAGKREQLLGEAYFLRAFYYFDLVQMFGEVPLITSRIVENSPKSPADKIYAQVTSDLLTAISLLPSTPYASMEKGRATKWAAESLLARVYLFYTGFYNKSALPTVDGKEFGSAEVIAKLEDCILNSGHALLDDQRNLWPYTNPYTAKDYSYTTDAEGNILPWVNYAGDTNEEVIFSLNFSNITGFNSSSDPYGSGYANRVVEFWGLRKAGNDNSFPFVPTGYSNGPVNRTLWEDWANDPDYAGDYRRRGSIALDSLDMPNYAGDNAKEMEKTHLYAKKYLGCGAYDGSTLRTSYAYFYGGQDDKQLGLTQSLIFIRFADVLLMHAELTNGANVPGKSKNGLNLVRERAQLADVTYSLDMLKKERRYELCFEALRWNDLRRWNNVEEIVKNQEGVTILNKKTETKYTFGSFDFMERYNATNRGFRKIPDSQVTLSEGVMTQNDGWDVAYDYVSLPY